MRSSTIKERAHPRFHARVRLLALIFALIGLICVARLYYLQIMQGAAYAAKADREFLAPINPLFDRGIIYFTTKDGVHIAAASNQSGVSLAVLPQKVTDPEALYQELSAVVPLSHDDFFSKITRSGAQYVTIVDHLSTTTGVLLQSKQISGISVTKDSWRQYPGGALAAQELGFVAYNENSLEGRYGIERYYESTLQRQTQDLYANFFVQLFAGVQETIRGDGQEGDVVTTIEPTLQTELERQLQNYMNEWHPQVAGGIIMDPQTGALYAMAVNPNFNLNQFSQESDAAIFENPLVENVYEMGSIIKPLTMAAGIDSGAITQKTTYNDTGCITVNTKKICNYDGKARGVIPMQEILSQSLNVGASFVATELGPVRMRDYFQNKYELGQETGIDLPNETHGLISNLQSPRQLEYDDASFGQGIAITPIETVRALAALANGGKLITPHLVSAIRTTAGLTRELSWGDTPQILKPETTTEVTQMLTNVVDGPLANGAVKLAHWSIAAKTGTAQIAKSDGGGYYSDRYLHSFFGYFPSYNARFIIFLFAYEPVGAQYASQTWASVFHELTQFVINYYNVPPDR